MKLLLPEHKVDIQLMTVTSFNAADIIEDTGDAYIVPHGGHYHYVPKSALSSSELAAAQAYLAGRGSQQSLTDYKPIPSVEPSHQVEKPATSSPGQEENNHSKNF